MYYERLTIPAEGIIDVPLPFSRGSRFFGIRVVAVVAEGQTPAQAYAGAALVMVQNTSNPAAGSNPEPNTADTIPIVDDSTLQLCSPETVQLESDNVGQQFDVFVLEGQAERIYPGGWGAIQSGGGGSVTPVVTQTSEVNIPDGAAPVLDTEGADTATATAIQVTLSAISGLFLAQGRLEAWGLYNGVIWMREPELDLDVTPAGGSAVWAFETISLAMGGTAAKPSRIAWRPVAVDDTIGNKAVDLQYQVTTPQNPVQVITDANDPQGSLGLNSAVTAPPTLTTDGVDLAGVNALQMVIQAPIANTINRAGSLAAFLLAEGGAVWARAPDLDLDIGGLTFYAVPPGAPFRRLIFVPTSIPVPSGRIAYRPSGMALTGGGVTVALVYATAAPVTGDVVGTPVTEAGLATPNAPAPASLADGVDLSGVAAVQVSVATSNGTDTIDAAGGFLAAYLLITVGATQTWVRAPSLDLTPTLGGLVALAFGAQLISVPAGRLAYRPSGLTLTPPGGTVAVTYQTAL